MKECVGDNHVEIMGASCSIPEDFICIDPKNNLLCTNSEGIQNKDVQFTPNKGFPITADIETLNNDICNRMVCTQLSF
jgi:hypothetical protein